ncbi:WYL domain-containing protein [Streptomyces angustmyceticus]|nr:WYL domain-containing protein [Streptomyces angustmyceticus]
MLRLGPEVEVLAPAAVRDRITATIRAMAALYG